MAFYVTGDCHSDWTKLLGLHENPWEDYRFTDRPELKPEDYICVLGDFGLWHYNDYDDENEELDELAQMPYTILWVDGNHDNFDRLYSDEFEIVDFHGGKAHKIRDNVYHLMRGYVFDFDGKKFFAFGGAQSHDIRDGILDPENYLSKEHLMRDFYLCRLQRQMVRINHYSWWEQELPSDEEMERGKQNLEANDWKVDYVLSHCCPANVASAMGFYDNDILTNYFDEIGFKLDFQHWYFGHYHTNKTPLKGYTCLYSEFREVA